MNDPGKRRLCKAMALAPLSSLAALAGQQAAAQTAAPWPAQTIRLVVPFAAGGATDVLARLLTEKLSVALRQPVIAENRPGAGATLGAAQVATSRPDGYTLMMMASSHLVAPVLYKSLPYDTLEDFMPITRLASSAFVMAINPQVPAKTVKEFIALAKSQPGKMDYGSSGNGGNQHLVGQMFLTASGTDLKHIPYKGSSPATTDLIGGQIQLCFMAVVNAIPHIKSGRLRALAITSTRRSPELPDLPTLAESGLPGFEANSWLGLVAPKGTPTSVIARLDSELQKIMASPETVKTLSAAGFDVDVAGTAEFSSYLRTDSTRWIAIAKSINMVPQ